MRCFEREFSKQRKKNFMALFYGWCSIVSRLEQARGDSLLFTTQFPGVLSTHLIDLRRTRGRVDLAAKKRF